MEQIVHRSESYEVMGACFEVYKEKGCGFFEAVYQECLEIEFNERIVLRNSFRVFRVFRG